MWVQAKDEVHRLLLSLFGLRVHVEDRGAADAASLFRRAGIAPQRGVDFLLSRLLPARSRRQIFLGQVRESVEAHRSQRVASLLPASHRRISRRTGLAEAIVATFEVRLRAGLEESRSGIGRLIDAGGELMSMDAWRRVVARQTDADLVVTNVPLLYGHRDGTALHALIRGGLIGGFVSRDVRRRRFGGTSVVTTHPLVSADPIVASLRGERLATPAVSRTLAALMAHELVHLVFAADDNYSHERCLMRPPSGLDFHRFWLGDRPVLPCCRCNRHVRVVEVLERAGYLAPGLRGLRRRADGAGRAGGRALDR
ncbi:MAG: hypothetical protein HY815_31220 [Candidatus Riflebacteria bacterium]|nr:hypothetical protein [Candidatus Riflebacteria bacterium]